MRSPILITGGCGFIGSHLADGLIARGHRVVVGGDYGQGKTSLVSRLAVRFGHFDADDVVRSVRAFLDDLLKAREQQHSDYDAVIADFIKCTHERGGGAYLAWTAGELLERGPAAKKTALALIRKSMQTDADDVTRTVLALLPDLHPNVAAELPRISARSVDARTVVVTSSILRKAEAALKEAAAAARPRFAPPRPWLFSSFDDVLIWTVDKSPLVRWVATAGAHIVVREAPRTLWQDIAMRVTGFLEEQLRRASTITTCRATFSVTKLLGPAWRAHPFDMARWSASILREGNTEVSVCLLASAVDALETRFRGRAQHHVPRLIERHGQVTYVAPPRDPWPQFGKAIAYRANRDETFRTFVTMYNERLEQWQRPRPADRAKQERSATDHGSDQPRSDLPGREERICR